MKCVIPLHFISWKKTLNDAVKLKCQSQFTPKMKANAESRNDKFQGIHALDSQVAKYFRNFRPTSALYWNNDSFHTKFNSPGMSGVCFYPNMSTFKNQDLYLPQTCSKSNQRNCLQRIEKIPDDSNWQHVRSWRSDVMEVLPSVVESSLLIAWIPWKLSFHYILFHEKILLTMLWHHNVRVNSHQRWKQTRFRVCFHLWCELTITMNVT